MLECKEVDALSYHKKEIKLDPTFSDSDLDFNIFVTFHDSGLSRHDDNNAKSFQESLIIIVGEWRFPRGGDRDNFIE